MKTPDTADAVLHAIDESETVWPHNDFLIEDQPIEMAVLYALGRPADDLPAGAALLRPAGNRRSPIRRLFDVVFGRAAQKWTDHDLLAAPCDRCIRNVQPEHTLWVPAGRSVVELHLCDDCRTTLDADFPGIVWE
jgi:hypothetical protein